MLTSSDWTLFNRCLFQTMDELYHRRMQFEIDGESLKAFRIALNEKGAWAWYVWHPSQIPKRESEAGPLPKEPRPSPKNKLEATDLIYTKWRSKYNNENLMSTPEGKEKKQKDREKLLTARRKTRQVKNKDGAWVNAFGTLEGKTGDWKELPRLFVQQYRDLVKEMKNTPEESRALANQLETLWEAQFATFHYISQPEFIKMHDKNELVTVSKFMYYETYANKICQLKRGSKERLAGLLYDLGKVLPRIFRKDKYDPFEAGEYRDKPLISVLHALGSFFRECYNIVVALPAGLLNDQKIMQLVNDKNLCQCIVDFDSIHRRSPTRYGVASQGVVFIKGLTEEEAVFVFATSPDVFAYNPDRSRQKRAKRIDSMIEFLRRSCLGIPDYSDRSGLERIKE